MADILIDWTQIGIILGLVVTSGGVIATYFKGVIKSNKDLSELEKRQNEHHAETSKQIAALDVKVSVFWTYLESNLPNILKRPTHLVMDALLEKFRIKTITHAELLQLRPMIQEILKEDLAPGGNRERALAEVLMLGLIDVRLKEIKL